MVMCVNHTCMVLYMSMVMGKHMDMHNYMALYRHHVFCWTIFWKYKYTCINKCMAIVHVHGHGQTHGHAQLHVQDMLLNHLLENMYITCYMVTIQTMLLCVMIGFTHTYMYQHICSCPWHGDTSNHVLFSNDRKSLHVQTYTYTCMFITWHGNNPNHVTR